MNEDFEMIDNDKLFKTRVGDWFDHKEQGFKIIERTVGKWKKIVIFRNIETQEKIKYESYFFNIFQTIAKI